MKTIKVSLGTNRCNRNSNNRRKNIKENIRGINNVNDTIEQNNNSNEKVQIKGRSSSRRRKYIRGINNGTKIGSKSIIMTDKTYEYSVELYSKKQIIKHRGGKISMETTIIRETIKEEKYKGLISARQRIQARMKRCGITGADMMKIIKEIQDDKE